MSYKHFGTHSLDDEAISNLEAFYEQGYILTRIDLERVRSIRVSLKDFELSSENRRILRKFEYSIQPKQIPYPDYTWEIHKMGKDFYDTKFGEGVFSANKIKEIFTSSKSFNCILTFNPATMTGNISDGYCVSYVSNAAKATKIVHYAYPFYTLELLNSSFGIYMMTKAVEYYKNAGFDYIYLGSAHESASLYKLQFKGIEWWDEKMKIWSTDERALKDRVRNLGAE